MQKFDAIIVLGEPVRSDGTVGTELKSRLDEAAKIFKTKVVRKIIVCGGITSHNSKKFSEAEGMKRYLISQNIGASEIIKEDYSKDTIGNALFAKIKILDSKKWKKLLVITSDYHMPRAKYIFKKLLGKKFQLEFRAAKSFLDPLRFEEVRLKENLILTLDKIFLEEFHMMFLKK